MGKWLDSTYSTTPEQREARLVANNKHEKKMLALEQEAARRNRARGYGLRFAALALRKEGEL